MTVEDKPEGNIIPLEGQAKSQDTPSDLSEDALAQRFVSKHGDSLRYVGQWHRWMTYDGVTWSVDHKLDAYEKARRVIREIAKRIFSGEMARGIEHISSTMVNASETERKTRTRELKKRSMALIRPLKSSKTVNAVVSLARHDYKIATSVDIWDGDPWLLNTPDGTLDLKAGVLRKHSPTDYMTMSTSCGPNIEKPKRWLEFLNQIMDGNQEMIAYLQRILGYCLTGTTGEQAMFFAFGAGANGKSVLLNVVGEILKGYHQTAPMETFIQTNEYRHPTELASLRGARIVTSTETQSGRRWDEVKIKRLTGGDPIAARFMRQDFFEYMPQFKLFIAGNHKPSINNVDEAMRRRLNFINFGVIIPKDKRDPDLKYKLFAEGGSILNWMIEGCLEWQRVGLHTPETVKQDTEQYMSAEDHFTAWWTERCEPNPRAFTTIADMYADWAAWMEKSGELIGSKKAFSQTVLGKSSALKIKYYQSNEGRGFRGVALKNPPVEGKQKA